MNRRRQIVLLASIALLVTALAPGGWVELRAAAGADQPSSVSASARFVPDVVGQFHAFPERAEALGWHIGAGPDPTMCKHWQGLARSHGMGTPYLFVTRSGNNTGACPGAEDDASGELVVVRLATRDGTGERLRSNRLVRDRDTDDSPPHESDRVVSVVHFDGRSIPGGGFWPHYYHPGGVQLVGDVLAVALEAPGTTGLPENNVAFLDVSDPEHPRLLSRFDPDASDGPSADDGWSAGLVALAPLANGRYLMLITGGPNDSLRIYTSDATDDDGTTDLGDEALTWTLFDDVSEREIEEDIGGEWPSGKIGAAHQMLNFVRQGDISGPLYLFGARNSSSGGPAGSDHIDLYRVDLSQGRFRLDQVGSRQLRALGTPTHSTLGCCDIANFAAASGVYVSPSGELLFYATEHDNDGPDATVKAGEWRHEHMVRKGSPTLDPAADAGGPYATTEGSAVTLHGTGSPPSQQAWLELFADDSFTERSVVVDYPDFDRDDFDDFKDLDGDPADINDFSDDPSSMRWFAPVGCTVRVNDDDYADSDFPGSGTRTLPGTGTVVELPDLDDVSNDSGSGDVDGQITSVTFFDNCAAYYGAAMELSWDLDRDGTYEAPGTDVAFSAAALDGPTLVEVPLRAAHPTDGRSGSATAVVRVDNAPPVLESAAVFDTTGAAIGGDVPVALAGLPVTLSATFSDPGVADTQIATIDWGDGTFDTSSSFSTFSDASGGASGKALQEHVYEPGTYDLVLTVVDDDGGEVSTSLALTVASPADAVDAVIGSLDAMIQSSVDLGARTALMEARDALAGNNAGLASNGARQELARGDVNAAVVKIIHAVKALNDAEAEGASGAEIMVLKDLLALATHSLAQAGYEEAALRVSPPNRGQSSRLAEIAVLIEHGSERLRADDHSDALSSFADAVRRAGAVR